MTNSHFPQGLTSQRRKRKRHTPSRNAPGRSAARSRRSQECSTPQRERLEVCCKELIFGTDRGCEASPLNHFAHPDTRILKTAEFREGHRKHRADDTPGLPAAGRGELAGSPLRRSSGRVLTYSR